MCLCSEMTMGIHFGILPWVAAEGLWENRDAETWACSAVSTSACWGFSIITYKQIHKQVDTPLPAWGWRAEAKGVSKIALVSESSPLPEPIWWGLPQDLGAANRKVGCPCAGGPTQEGPWRATWGAGALLPQCCFSSEQALSDPLIKAEF